MHTLWALWINYGWSSLKGNGPEAVVQTLVYAAAAVLLIPPVRRFVLAEFHKVHSKIDKGHLELHAKLDHIIEHHPDIPPFPKK